MENKRVRQFFELTAQNIRGTEAGRDDLFILDYKKNKVTKSGSSKRSFLRMSLVAVLVCYLLTHLWQVKHPIHQSISPVAINPIQMSKIAKHELEKLPESRIPNYQVAALRQVLRVFPLHKIDVVRLDNGDSEINESLRIVDKVVVMPKVFVYTLRA